FTPTPGVVGSWTMPSGPGVRVDTAIRAGDRIPPDYDPMIAKILTVGPDRTTALGRMRRALDEVEVTGIQTTLPFDRALVRDPAFARADALSTDWVAGHWDGEADRADVMETAMVVAAEVAAHSATGPAATASSLRKDRPASPWRDAGRADALERWPR
ncbi:MAG: acetyl-/propionyl-CoA carboxylase subunit alpha, partial [Candidatus Limnocylindrales bacterium]